MPNAKKLKSAATASGGGGTNPATFISRGGGAPHLKREGAEGDRGALREADTADEEEGTDLAAAAAAAAAAHEVAAAAAAAASTAAAAATAAALTYDTRLEAELEKMKARADRFGLPAPTMKDVRDKLGGGRKTAGNKLDTPENPASVSEVSGGGGGGGFSLDRDRQLSTTQPISGGNGGGGGSIERVVPTGKFMVRILGKHQRALKCLEAAIAGVQFLPNSKSKEIRVVGADAARVAVAARMVEEILAGISGPLGTLNPKPYTLTLNPTP
jgi:hypothetical protein